MAKPEIDPTRLVGPPTPPDYYGTEPRQTWIVPSNARLVDEADETGRVVGKAWWVPYGEGWEIPVGFEYGGEGPFKWSIWIQIIFGVAECVGIRGWSAGGAPIRAADLRALPIGRLVNEAVLLASRPADEIPRRPILWKSVEEAQKARARVAEAHRRVARNPRQRGRVTDELLQEVARVYREELAGGRPTAEVAEQLNYSRPSAGRLVMEARRRGFLPPTEPRRARA
jgi:hypothetical protein